MRKRSYSFRTQPMGFADVKPKYYSGTATPSEFAEIIKEAEERDGYTPVFIRFSGREFTFYDAARLGKILKGVIVYRVDYEKESLRQAIDRLVNEGAKILFLPYATPELWYRPHQG